MMKICVPIAFVSLAFSITFCFTSAMAQDNKAQLLRVPYDSVVDNIERDYFLYLPEGYDEKSAQKWPVLIFLHGDGQRGNGKADLDFVLDSGPLYEAWIQKRNLPFLIIAPQNHMFGQDGEDGPDYIRNRTRESIPQRLDDGVPPRKANMPAREWFGPMRGSTAAEELPSFEFAVKTGWRKTDPDLINILDKVLSDYRADSDRVYLTGLSLGGFGAWYFASQYPEKFAAMLPVVGFPSVQQAEAVARAGIPTWVFSGGRDPVVETEHFFLGLNRMEELGANIRFTTEQDMSHDVWNRVYAGEDVYTWLLKHKKR